MRLLLGAVLLLVVACGDDAGNPFGTDGSGSTTLPGETTTSTTAGGSDDFFDLSAVVATPPSAPLVGVDALLGGPADESVSLALTAAAAAAVDLTGVEITVWPVTGTGESLLVIDFAETATAFADDEAQGGDLLSILLASPLIDDRSITRVVMRIRGTDEQGPYIFTLTAPTAAMRANLATGVAIPEDQLLMEIVREEP